MPETTKPERILLAHVAGAHGIRGELLLKTYTGAPEDVAAYGPLSDQAGARQFTVRVVRVTPKGVIARIQGIDNRNAAESATNAPDRQSSSVRRSDQENYFRLRPHSPGSAGP